ncbi:hypothetical protein J5N58_24470 [Rhizobium cremeum]|uniref:hypothetical protein n=1 Tax=Rhizobium cremeum TaxID=2813827 RepID=UPI001FD5D678|nr:hypothetical protein [Rhizobium cremeum]MCJ7997748.1 hypothetical protein [Rhizobium cremeum]MCJ8002842.1 hypothetical protein [Rhizobium cremeum]
MTRGVKVDVGDGWAAIILNIIVVGSAWPPAWGFRLHRAWRNSGRMRIHVTTDGDDPVSLEATSPQPDRLASIRPNLNPMDHRNG